MTQKSVYLETSFISYLTARLSRDLVAAGHQTITREWWEHQRQHFHLYVSEPVKAEAEQGNPEMATKRLTIIADIELISVTDEAIELGKRLMQGHAIPAEAAIDALHVALSCVSGMHYLLTWNCKHIANAQRMETIQTICIESGYKPPIICTPEELLGDYYDLD